jgi:asparagine synthetase B (glutamine-hydrolysing)
MGILMQQEDEHSLRVEIPSTTASQFYYRTNDECIDVTDDLRKLVRPSDTLDERAIYSILQFGAAIPPLSPWKEIGRIVPGRNTTFRDNPVRIEEADFPRDQVLDQDCRSLELDQQIVIVLDALDHALLAARQRHPIVILFSGGIDSGLLAARAAALGLQDTLLVNYCFGSDDAESLLAEQMAKHLGLSFHRIQDDGSGADVEEVLKNAGRDYRTPFCDHSAVPTGKLVRSVIGTYGSEYAMFDGTGADGAFGLFGRSRQWQKLHSLPSGLRGIGSFGYQLFRLWQENSKSEYWLRLLRRASQHRFPLSAIAQNPLDGIAYHVPKQVSLEVESMGISWLHSISPEDPHLQLAAADLSLVCSGIFAQKSKSLFAASDIDIIYPYLSPEMVRIAFSSGNWQGADQEAKWLLKAALARHVPAEMVYRPKSGFVAPMSEKFKSEAFHTAFDKVCTGESPLSPFLEERFFKAVREKLTKEGLLPAQTINLVWAVIFVSEWLDQVTSAATIESRGMTVCK